MDKAHIELSLGNEQLTPLELFKRIKRREDSSEQLRSLKKMMVRAIKEELTPRQKQCVLLHYIHGYSQREIAKKLHLSPSVVCRHVARGLLRLQRALQYACILD